MKAGLYDVWKVNSVAMIMKCRSFEVEITEI